MMVNKLCEWLSNHFLSDNFVLEPLVGDAGFRRYFRVHHAESTWIVMDAALERDKCQPFIIIADALRAKGLCTPAILAENLPQGWLLLTDFGDQRYLDQLNAQNAERLYTRALESLASLARCYPIQHYPVPVFTETFMQQELAECQQWFLERHLGLTLTARQKQDLAYVFNRLVKFAASQPYVLMHRDYHSANLMVLPDNQVGILDFQDACHGPITYDLVSLLRDCYIAWSHEWIENLALCYREIAQLSVSPALFLQWFDWMGIQRHLKALLTFSRKYRRDHDARYLSHIPRTVRYVIDICERYPELQKLHGFFSDNIAELTLCEP
jgi:aminoglycoside/choline kinase family phosphotransferase